MSLRTGANLTRCHCRGPMLVPVPTENLFRVHHRLSLFSFINAVIDSVRQQIASHAHISKTDWLRVQAQPFPVAHCGQHKRMLSGLNVSATFPTRLYQSATTSLFAQTMYSVQQCFQNSCVTGGSLSLRHILYAEVDRSSQGWSYLLSSCRPVHVRVLAN